MSSKNLYFWGLLALACLILDSYTEDPTPDEAEGDARPQPASGDGERIAHARAGCPRNAAHRAHRRADGAIWCLRCDEAFFPRAVEWESALRPVGV